MNKQAILKGINKAFPNNTIDIVCVIMDFSPRLKICLDGKLIDVSFRSEIIQDIAFALSGVSNPSPEVFKEAEEELIIIITNQIQKILKV